LLEKQQARCLTRLEELAGKYYAGVMFPTRSGKEHSRNKPQSVEPFGSL
jgi:hypothetical protein